jgi:hypothetical protein
MVRMAVYSPEKKSEPGIPPSSEIVTIVIISTNDGDGLL